MIVEKAVFYYEGQKVEGKPLFWDIDADVLFTYNIKDGFITIYSYNLKSDSELEEMVESILEDIIEDNVSDSMLMYFDKDKFIEDNKSSGKDSIISTEVSFKYEKDECWSDNYYITESEEEVLQTSLSDIKSHKEDIIAFLSEELSLTYKDRVLLTDISEITDNL
jgi:predicted transcriptional regulator